MPVERLHPDSVLVVLVDLSEGPLRSVHSTPQPELRLAAECLAEACALLNLPVLCLHAPLPGDLAKPVLDVPGARSITHRTNDSWQTAEFVELVRTSGRQQLVFAGIATDVGVALTALSAVRAGYQVAVLTDASGTVSARAEQSAFYRLALAGVELISWSAFVAEVQGNYLEGRGPELLRIVGRGTSDHGFFQEVSDGH